MTRPSPIRVAARYADLSPPLGYPGGPCHVIQRIREEVRNPDLQEKLVDNVEDGEKLSNPEAAAIYDLESDRGAGRFKKLRITPHAQYRMDQRGIIVNELRIALKSFQKAWGDDKSRQGFRWKAWEEEMARGKPIRWEDPQIKLAVVFVVNRDTATLVTAYWEGQSDPRPEDEDSCPARIAHRYAARIAGLFQPPKEMVKEIGAWALAQIAANKIGLIQGEIRKLKRHRQEESPRYDDLRRSMKALHRLLPSGKSRELFKAYQDFWQQALNNFGYTGIPKLKMQSFSGLKDPKRRDDLTRIALQAIEHAEERIEGSLSYGEREIPKQEALIKEFKAFAKAGIKPMKGNEVIQDFRVNLDDWYVGHEAIEKIQDREVQEIREMIDRMKERYEERGESPDKDLQKLFNDMLDRAQKKWNSIPVKLMQKIDSKRSRAYWHPMSHTVVIEVPAGSHPAQVERSLMVALIHELKHMGQSLMEDWLGGKDLMPRGPGPGKPSRHITTPEYQQDQEQAPAKGVRPKNLHHLDDVEFYTDLADALRRMGREMEDLDKRRKEYDNPPLTGDEKKAVFTRQIGNTSGWKREYDDLVRYIDMDPFFRTLKQHAKPKWKKAVSEGYKELFGSGSSMVRLSFRTPFVPGVQTYVTEESAKGLPSDSDSQEPDSAAALPGSAVPGGAGRDIGKFEYSTPSSDSDIKPRTLSEPGEDRGHPTNVLNNYITRRTLTSEERLVEAWEAGPPGPERQHRQKPSEQRKQNREEYKPNRNRKRMLALRRYNQFCKKNMRCMMKRKMYRDNPRRYKRRAPQDKAPGNKEAGDIILYDQENPANNEIKHPGKDVNYDAVGPTTYEFAPDEREGVPPGHELPSNETDNVPPASSRVIPDSMKEELRDSLTYMKAAATIAQIIGNTSSTVVGRAQSVRIKPYRFNPKNGFWSFHASGSKGTYIIRVKGIRKGNVKNLEKAQIKVSCSCGFFRWQGPEHWAKANRYLYGRPTGSASNPKVMDPKGHHWACKHVVAALRKARGWRFSSPETHLWDIDAEVFPDVEATLAFRVAERFAQRSKG